MARTTWLSSLRGGISTMLQRLLPKPTDREDDERYLQSAKDYWKYAPGGTGKIDTAELLTMSDKKILAAWQRNFDLRRDLYWEEKHYIRTFREKFHLSGKRIFSFGCGLGYAEMEFLEHGASVTFADIVPSNVECVRRLCQLKGFDRAKFLVMEDSAATDFGNAYDCVFAYGSLMHMPEDRQRKVLAQFRKSLTPDGVILLMLYTKQFVSTTGGNFDQRKFARLTDPDVGAACNPWSDWHDDEKLARLAGPELRITHRQFFNEDLYVWYALRKRQFANGAPPTEFADWVKMETDRHDVACTIAATDFTAAAASVRREEDGRLQVQTDRSNYSYALVGPIIDVGTLARVPNKVAFHLELTKGGASIGILDAETNEFACSRDCIGEGARHYFLPVPADRAPRLWRVVASNFQPKKQASSQFAVSDVRLVRDRGALQDAT